MENISGYTSGADVGQAMSARGIGEVVESRSAKIAVGDKVVGAFGWQEYASLNGAAVEVLPDDDLLTANLGPLGGTGLTAYFGLLRIGRPEPGDDIVVSGAAGAVGSMVVQIARILGGRVIGIAGAIRYRRNLVSRITDELVRSTPPRLATSSSRPLNSSVDSALISAMRS